MSIFNKYQYDENIKLRNFEKYVDRFAIARFLARYELFKLTKNVKGSIVECGVHYGGGLMGWAKMSSIIEPYAVHRKIIGFDTFEGFPSLTKQDYVSEKHDQLVEGGFKSHNYIIDEIKDCIKTYDSYRYLNHYEKVEIIKGDAVTTIPEYINKNSHLIISLLFIDFDLYEPTKVALENFVNRMPKGAIIAFDEINNPLWKGETTAVLEHFKGINNLEIKKFEFDPNIAYAII